MSNTNLKPQVLLAAFGVAVALVGVALFVHRHAFALADAIHICIAIPLALIAVYVSDYVLHHARLVFVLVVLALVFLVASSPAFAVGLGVTLLGLAIMEWRSA